MRYLPYLLLTLLVLTAKPAWSQVEVGTDGSLSLLTYDEDYLDNATEVDIPSSLIRASFMISSVTAVEFATGIRHRSYDGRSTTQLHFGVRGLYHLKELNTDSPAPFIIAGGELDHRGGSGLDDTQFSLGAGMGFKVPFTDNLHGRLSGQVLRLFESDRSAAATEIRLDFGISYVLW